MGWTSYHATHYYNNGTINRKAECDDYFIGSINNGYYEIVKSTMVGSVYYAAVKCLKRYSDEKDAEGNRLIEDIPKEEQKVFAVVFLTSVDMKDHFNFSYKNMDESMGPAQSECPESILDLLSPTESDWANEWRERCRKVYRQKKTLKDLPVGANISIVKNGEERILTKSLIGGKSSPIWVDWNMRTKYPLKSILDYGFQVV